MFSEYLKRTQRKQTLNQAVNIKRVWHKTCTFFNIFVFLCILPPQCLGAGQSERLEKGVKKSAACGQKNELWQTGDRE